MVHVPDVSTFKLWIGSVPLTFVHVYFGKFHVLASYVYFILVLEQFLAC